MRVFYHELKNIRNEPKTCSHARNPPSGGAWSVDAVDNRCAEIFSTSDIAASCCSGELDEAMVNEAGR